MPVTIPATGTGTATPVVATDQISGQEYQVVKLDLGALGVSSPVSIAIPIGGFDGNSLQRLLTDSIGRLRVNIDEMPAIELDGEAIRDGKFTVQGESNAIPVPVSLVPNVLPGYGWIPQAFYAQTTTVRTLKASGGDIGWYYISNPNASIAYVQFFDTAGEVTLGTTVPKMSWGIPASSAANSPLPSGLSFMYGIRLACTTTETGNTAPGSGLTLNFGYK